MEAVMRASNLAVPLLLLGLLAGCDSLGFGQGDEALETRGVTSATVDGLRVHLFAPDTVAVGEAFVVRVAVQNQTKNDASVTTPGSCLVTPGIFDGEGERVGFKGSIIGCLGVVTTHEIPAGEVMEGSFDVEAVLYTREGDEPVAPGEYTVRANLEWTERTIERELVVRP